MTEMPVPIVSGARPGRRDAAAAAAPIPCTTRCGSSTSTTCRCPPGTPGELVVRTPRAVGDQRRATTDMPEATARGLAQRLVPHRRRVPAATTTATSTSSTASRTRSAGAARTSRRSRSRTEVAVPPGREGRRGGRRQQSRLEESAGDEEVKVVVVLEDGADARPGRARSSTSPADAQPLGAALRRVRSRSCRARSRSR